MHSKHEACRMLSDAEINPEVDFFLQFPSDPYAIRGEQSVYVYLFRVVENCSDTTPNDNAGAFPMSASFLLRYLPSK